MLLKVATPLCRKLLLHCSVIRDKRLKTCAMCLDLTVKQEHVFIGFGTCITRRYGNEADGFSEEAWFRAPRSAETDQEHDGASRGDVRAKSVTKGKERAVEETVRIFAIADVGQYTDDESLQMCDQRSARLTTDGMQK